MTDNQPFYFLLTWEDRRIAGDHNNFYTTFSLRPVFFADNGETRLFGTWDGDRGVALADLAIKASLACHRDKSREDFLSWETSYQNPWNVNMGRAEAMVKTLKTIKTSLDKAAKRDGLTASFGQYVLRVCRALGAAGILIEDEDARRHEGRETYWERKDGEVVNTVDFQIQSAKWRAQEAFKDAEAEALV